MTRDEALGELRRFFEKTGKEPYLHFEAGKARNALVKMGLIERWNPTLKTTGRKKPWRITEAGVAMLLAQDAED